MATLERQIDRGTRLGRAGLARLGQELRESRRDRGLSLRTVGAGAGLSVAEQSRIERGLAPRVPFITLARFAAVVALDLVARTYPGPQPIRDTAQAALLASLREPLHRSIRWTAEMPVPAPR